MHSAVEAGSLVLRGPSTGGWRAPLPFLTLLSSEGVVPEHLCVLRKEGRGGRVLTLEG